MTRIIHMIEKLLTSNQEFQFQLKCSNILYPVSPTEYSYKILMKCIEQLQENADVLGGLGKKIRFGGTKKWQCPLFLSFGIFHPELSSPETWKQVLKLRHRELRRALLLRLKKQERKFLTLGDSTDILHFFFLPFHFPILSHPSAQAQKQTGTHTLRENFSLCSQDLGFNRVGSIAIVSFTLSVLPLLSPGHRKTTEMYSKTGKLKHQLIIKRPKTGTRELESTKEVHRGKKGKHRKLFINSWANP